MREGRREGRREGGREGGKEGRDRIWMYSKIYCKKEEFDFFSMAQDIIKKAEHRRIDAFESRCWTGLLKVPWTGNQP